MITLNRACFIIRLLGYAFRISWRYHVSGPLRPMPEFSYWKVLPPPDVQIHKGCGAEAINVGEDCISYCTECEHICEGDTEYISAKNYEARA